MKRLISFIIVIAICCSLFTACSPKYKCYKGTHIPKIKNVVDIEPDDRFDPEPYFTDYGRELINSFGFIFDKYGYTGIRETELEAYYDLLIEEGFSQSFEKSTDNLICFINNTEDYFQIVVIIYGVNNDGDEIALILVSENEGGVSEEAYSSFLGY